jgi:hypothetical protein
LGVLAEIVAKTQNKRFFGAYNDQFNTIVDDKLTYGLWLIGVEGYIGAVEGSTCIAWRYEKLCASRTLGKFESEGVLASATAQQEYLHGVEFDVATKLVLKTG